MAWGTWTQISTPYTNKTSDTAAFTASGVTAAPETLLVIVGACDNATANTPTINAISKPVGTETRSWRVIYHTSLQSGAAAGTIGYIAYIRTSVQWTNLLLQATFSTAVAAKHATMWSNTGGLPGDNVAVSVSGQSSASNSGVTCGSTSSVDAGSMAVAIADQEQNAAPVSLWFNGTGGTALVAAATSGGSAVTNIGVVASYRIIPTTGTVTLYFNGTAAVEGGAVLAIWPDVPPDIRITRDASWKTRGTVVVTRPTTWHTKQVVPGTSAVTTGPNLLSANDASFETGLGNWSFGSAALSTVRAHSGTQSMLIDPWSGRMQCGVTLTRGKVYTLSGWTYVPSGSPDVQLKMWNGDTAGGWYIADPVTVKDTWVRSEVTFIAENSNYMWLSPTTGYGAGQCWLDDLSIRETGVPNPVVFDDFEGTQGTDALFNRTTSTGRFTPVGNKQWLEGAGDWGLVGGAVQQPAGGSVVVDAGLTDCVIDSLFYTGATSLNGNGLAIRFSDNNNALWIYAQDYTWKLQQNVAASSTILATGGASQISRQYQLRVVCKGSNVTVYLRGGDVPGIEFKQILQGTILPGSPGLTATKYGLSYQGGGAYWDSFSVSPLALVADDFTGTDNPSGIWNGTASTRSTLVGAKPWVGTNTSPWGISSGRAVNAVGSGILVVDSGVSDCVVECDYNTGSPQDGGLAFRWQDTNNTLRLLAYSGKWILQRIAAASGTDISPVPGGVGSTTPSTTYRVRIELQGPNIRILVDGQFLMEVVEPAFVNATKHGLAANNQTSVWWDNFSVTPLPLPVTRPASWNTYVLPLTSPRQVPGLVGWYSSVDSGTTTSGSMTWWKDLSGLQNHGVPTGTPQWTATGGENGGPGVTFSGGNQYFTLPNLLSGAAAGEIFATLKSTDMSTDQSHWKLGSDAGQNHYPYSDGKIYDDFGSTNRRGPITPTVDISATWRRLNIWSAANDWAMNLNEVSQLTSGTNTVGWNAAPRLGAAIGGGATLRYGVVLIFNRKLTAPERSQVTEWLIANPAGGSLRSVGYFGVADDFNRADSGTLGAPWTTPPTHGVLGVTSNQAYAVSPGGDDEAMRPGPGGSDMKVSLTIPTLVGGGGSAGVIARATAGEQPFYMADVTNTGAVRLFARSGAYNQLGSSTAAGTFVAGQTLTLSCVGSTIQVLVDGVAVNTQTDTTVTSGDYVGIRTSNATGWRLDNFSATTPDSAPPKSTTWDSLQVVRGNFNWLGTNASGFETDVSAWTSQGSSPPTRASSTVRATQGTKSMLVTWTGGGGVPYVRNPVAFAMVIGMTYRVSADVWVPSGSPNVRVGVESLGGGAYTSVKDAWVTVTYTFSATATAHNIYLEPTPATLAGTVYMDNVFVLENAVKKLVSWDVFVADSGVPSTIPKLAAWWDPSDINSMGLVSVDDDFNRADSATVLGSTTTGQAWAVSATGGVTAQAGISSNRAYFSSFSGSATAFAVIDAGVADTTLEVTFPIAYTDQGLTWRYVDVNNQFAMNKTTAYRRLTGGFTTIITFSQAFTTGDRVKVMLSGNTHTIYKNDVQVGTFSDANFNTATKHGIASFNDTAGRFDDFKVYRTSGRVYRMINKAGGKQSNLIQDNATLRPYYDTNMPGTSPPMRAVRGAGAEYVKTGVWAPGEPLPYTSFAVADIGSGTVIGHRRSTIRSSPGTTNLLSANASSMETDISAWSSGGTIAATLASDTAHVQSGTKALKITWNGGSLVSVNTVMSGLVVGRGYTATAWVWVPTGSADVRLIMDTFMSSGSVVTTKDTWVQATHMFTATATTHQLGVYPEPQPASGTAWVDNVAVVEMNQWRLDSTQGVDIGPMKPTGADLVVVEWQGGGATRAWINGALMGSTFDPGTPTLDKYALLENGIFDGAELTVGLVGENGVYRGVLSDANRNTLSSYLMAKWAINPTIAVTRSTSWNVAAPKVPITKVLGQTTWNIRQAVTPTRVTTWDTRYALLVTGGRSTSWKVRQAVTKALGQTTWKTRQAVALTRVTTWDATFAIVRTRATTWNIRAAPTITRSTSWDVAAAITQVTVTRLTSWMVDQAVLTSRVTTWDVTTPAVLTRSTTWDSTSVRTLARATTWDASAAVSTARSTTWRARQAVALTRITTWDSRVAVALSRGTTWDVLGVVATFTRSTTWDSTTAAVLARTTTWDVLSARTITRGSSTWNIRQAVTRARATTWNFKAASTLTKSTTWDTLTVVIVPAAPGPDEQMLDDTPPTIVLAGTYTLGAQFVVNEDGFITHVRYYHVDGCPSVTHTVSVWDANTQAKLATTTFTPGGE